MSRQDIVPLVTIRSRSLRTIKNLTCQSTIYRLTKNIKTHRSKWSDWAYSNVGTNVQAVRTPPGLISAEIAIVRPLARTLAGRQTSIGILWDGCVGETAHGVNAVSGDARHISIVWKERAIGGVALRGCKAQDRD